MTKEEALKILDAPEDYRKADAANLTEIDRWQEAIKHHPMSMRIMEFLSIHDCLDYDDYFSWKYGGDGDNGEELMFQLDAFFELLDIK